MPTQIKGGTYSQADIPLIRDALQDYLLTLRSMRTQFDDPEIENKMKKVGNLLHRLERIPSKK